MLTVSICTDLIEDIPEERIHTKKMFNTTL